MLSRQLACARKPEVDCGTTYLSISHRMYVCVCVYKLAVSFICRMYSSFFITPCAADFSSFIVIRGIMNKMANGDEHLNESLE